MPPELAGFHDAEERRNQVFVRCDNVQVGAGAPSQLADRLFLRFARRPQPAAELRLAGVHQQLLAGFRIRPDNQAGVGQVEFTRVDEADGHYLVTLGELQQ